MFGTTRNGILSRSALGVLGVLAALACVMALLPASSARALGASRSGAESPRLLYVAPGGHGDGCTASDPCSLGAAQATVRRLAPDADRDIDVELADGRYRISSPLRFGAADSGQHGHTVAWQAAPGAHPVLDGGVRVTGWHKQTGGDGPAKNIWEAPVPAGTASNQLYVNGVRAVRARGLGCPASQCSYTPAGLSGVSPDLARFAHPQDLVAVMDVRWRDFQCPVSAASGTDVTLAQPCWNNANVKTQTDWQSASPSSSAFQGVAYFENAYELLGAPGQFYLDEHTSTLYYVPRPGQDLPASDVELPTSQGLLDLTGTVGDPVHDIRFAGITFADTTWLQPDTDEGYAGAQAGYYVSGAPTGTLPGDGESYTRTPTAATVTAGARIDFSGDVFTRLGAAGLALVGGTRDSVVEDSTFTDLSAGGVFVGDTQHAPSDPRLKASGNVVRRDTVSGAGEEFHDAVGIMGGYNNGLTIDHNTVTDVPYTGISVGWGWDFVGSADTQNDVVVAYNHISDFMQQLYDGGAIYTQAQSPGSMVYANYIDFAGVTHGNGVYHDERSSDYTTSDNVVWNTPKSSTDFHWVSSWAPYSAHLIVHGNWTDAAAQTVHNGSTMNTYGPNDTGLTALPPAARDVIRTAGAQAPPESRSVTFTHPTSHDLAGLTTVAVDAPYDTRSVRFSMDGVAFAEITRLYAEGTGLTPQWQTDTDASYFTPGRHMLRATAITGQGDVSAEIPVVTSQARQPAGTSLLDGGWHFATAAELPSGALDGSSPPAVQPGFDDASAASVVVPDSYGAVRDAWNDDNGTVSLYRREFTAPPPAQRGGARTRLVFDSCFFACEYFVNGHPVGTSLGGYLPARFDVTSALVPGRNVIAVVVDDRVSTVDSYGINSQLHWNWGGLIGDVHLEHTGRLALTSLTADGSASGALSLRADAINATGAQERIPAEITVLDPRGRTALRRQVTFTVPHGSDERTSAVALDVPHPALWSLGDPALYRVRVRPLDPGEALGGALDTDAGFRTIAVKGSDVLLNGALLQDLHGFNREADYPGLGRTQPDGLAWQEMRQAYDHGLRIFRPAHYPTTPAELDAADKLGMLVLEEDDVTQANAAQLASSTVVGFAEQRLDAMIDRDRGHPSIVIWSVGNENATNTPQGAAYVHTLIDYGKQLDATRLFTHVTAWGTADQAYAYDDIVAGNNYDGWYYNSAAAIGKDMDALQAYAGGKPLLLSEYGAEAVKGRPGTGPGTDYYQAQLVDTYNRELDARPHFLGQMYWTSTEFMLTPAGGGGDPIPVPGFHDKGLVTYFRQPKLAWKVITTPVDIDPLPPVTAAPGKPVDTTVTVTLRSVDGRASHGVLTVAAPPGFTATPSSAAFAVPAGGTARFSVTLTGTAPAAGGATAEVKAVVAGDEYEALPQFLALQA